MRTKGQDMYDRAKGSYETAISWVIFDMHSYSFTKKVFVAIIKPKAMLNNRKMTPPS